MVFCSDARDPESVALFSGTNSKDRFSDILSTIVSQLTEAELVMLGCERTDIAPYSARKGSATFANGQIAGPNPVAVQLRMGHSLGKVNDPYLHLCDPQDQLCGRLVALLPIVDEQFGALPPHFTTEAASNLTVEFWRDVVPGYDVLPVEYKPTLKYLLATILYHEPFLRRELDKQHPLFSSRIFAGNPILAILRSGVITGTGLCKLTGMQASGLPPHVVQAGKLDTMKQSVEDLRSHIERRLDELSNGLHESLGNNVVEKVRGSFLIEGALPVTLNDMAALNTNIRTAIRDEVRKLQLEHNTSSEGPSSLSHSSANENCPSDSSWWREFNWNDGLIKGHPVPAGWRFPTCMNVRRLWDL